MSCPRSALVVPIALLLLPGCGRPITLQPLPARHPASPQAPEAPVQPAPSALTQQPEATPARGSAPASPAPPSSPMPPPSAGHAHEAPEHQHEASAPAVYTCPMHPDVQASEPGSCPKCGMALRRVEAK
jgi:hypothetical protein